MPKYTIDENFDVKRYEEAYKQYLLREKHALERNLAKAVGWKKRLDKMNAEDVGLKVAHRLIKLREECLKQGLTFKEKGGYSRGINYGGNKVTSFKKDKVKLVDLTSQLDIHPDGSVCLDVYKIPKDKADRYYYHPSAADKVMRIYVGDAVRVTNHVLRSLLNKV